MARERLEVADIFRAHGPAWRSANAGHLSLGHCMHLPGDRDENRNQSTEW